MSFPNTVPYHYEINKESLYYRELIPKPMFEGIFAKVKQMAIGFLCQQDPSHAELYKTKFMLINDCLEAPFFKESLYEMFAGCTDPESDSFKVMMRSSVAKTACYGRFCLERFLEGEELKKIEIKKPIYIVALPRSGSTFTHTMLGCDPHSKKVLLYEHLCPGSHTMSKQARLNIAEMIIGQITNDGKDMNKCHNMDNMLVPEEELFFMEILACTYIFGTAMPRWEQYRKSCFERDFSSVYHGILDEMKMSAIEEPLKEDQYFLMKCVCHFMTPIPFFNIMCSDEIEPRIVWIHREPVDEFKSAFYLLLNARARYQGDIGETDYKWLQENIIKMNTLCLKNSLEMREKWVAEKPERAKQICDIGFREMINDPIKVSQRIYNQFGLDLTEEIKQTMIKTKEEGDPQKGHGRKEKKDDEFLISDDEIREHFKWYYEKYGKYMPNYWGKK
ncbi:hypothetical protein ENUP19_0046G0078 [Entamoeba nuttalli]|uniref:Sulfotransferase, putative n=2 Tax=Entamoeba nuttalli TaxID=412467 RepID=K2H3D1_ENTNP|nr:sulfotransferase, putative [Entamoeba nuttalli P19]EKE36939.1 sulfotransferase, putative [Entamoeba nuttalli P19]|eukprot:XP_008860727.1 sulfotransferase, putative [Entamoeba nuttalli P19]